MLARRARAHPDLDQASSIADVPDGEPPGSPLSAHIPQIFLQSGKHLSIEIAGMNFDPGEDHEARQLALLREQKPIVAALRSVGYPIDFLFSPPPGPMSETARALLEEFLDTPLSLETKLIISDLIEAAGGEATRARYDAPSRSTGKDR